MLNSALSIIIDEHRSLAAVVRGLRRLLSQYRLGRLPTDLRLLRAIVAYLDEFPRELHQLREDAYLFARLQTRTHCADPIIQELRAQHLAGAGHVAALHTALERLDSGAAGGMEAFAAAVDDFADYGLRHMTLEESILIPLAGRYLSGEDWVEIGAAFGENGDPRFVSNAAHDFAGLFDRIMALTPPTAGPDLRAP